LALQLSSEEVWKKPSTTKAEKKIEATETDENGACCSKNVIDSVKTSSQSITIPQSTDDEVIAQLLQAEFDIEFDEELKRLEQSRNKSELKSVVKFNEY
jgi:hypothetical protein